MFRIKGHIKIYISVHYHFREKKKNRIGILSNWYKQEHKWAQNILTNIFNAIHRYIILNDFPKLFRMQLGKLVVKV